MSDMYVPPGTEGVTPAVNLDEFAPKLPAVSDEKSYASVKAGSAYLDPEGKKRFKPIGNKADYEAIGEGEQYADPEGTIRTKPVFEPIDFTAQTLYDMAVTPSEKRKALERTYPGKVKQDDSGLFVEDEGGKYRRPGRGLTAAGGFMTAAAAPTIGGVVGALGGGVTGPVGGALGAAGGSILGQTINDVVLQLAGVYDRNITEQAAATGLAGGSALMGFGVGRGVATVVPAAKAGVSSASQMLPSAAAHFLGAGPELTAARELAEKGVKVPPSAWAHEAPHLQNIVEVFDPAFRTDKPLLKSATEHYEKSAKTILDDLGVKTEESIVKPGAAVPTQRAGEVVMQRTLAESAKADQALQAALEQRKTALASGIPEQMAQREAVIKAAEESRQAAQRLIDEGFKSIQKEADTARKIAGSGINTGDLWQSVGDKLRALRQGVSERARYWYDRYDEMTGGATVRSEGLSSSAQQILDELPQEFAARNPALVQRLAKLASQYDEAGVLVKEAEPLTYGQVHELRNLFRGASDWYTLSSDFKNGTLKHFSREIDAVIHDPNAPVHIQSAAKFLDGVDKWYGHNIRVFDSQQLKAVMKGLEAGEPADPANLYKVLIKEGQTDLTERVKKMVGPNLWAGVKAADTDAMITASKTLNPGEIDGRKFAAEVLERYRNGTLEIVHGREEASRILQQARMIEQLDGRLPIPANALDTPTQIIARARMAADEAKALGQKDPLLMLTREVKKAEAELKREASAERRNDPLGFLYKRTTGASEAVDKILQNEDLILAAATRFGEKSPEFNALRQVYVERLLRSGMRPATELKTISPEVQNLMFPGVTRSQMELLANEMELLMPRRGMGKTTAGSMSAMSKVENPVSGMPGLKGAVKLVPGLNPAARAGRTQFYKLITNLMTSPATLRWIEKGLTKGTPEEQEAVRNILRAHLQRGGAMGTGAGEATYQGMGE